MIEQRKQRRRGENIIAYLGKESGEGRDRSEPRSVAQGSAHQHRME